MTKEELEKEAEEKYVEVDREFIACQDEGEVFNIGYVLGAEPREKRIAELEKENAELRKIAEFQQSSNMQRHFENKKLKEGLAVGETFNKALNSMNKSLEEERDKYRDMVFDLQEENAELKKQLEMSYKVYNDNCDYSHHIEGQLTKAKDHIKKLLDCLKQDTNDPQTNYYVCQYMDKAEQFLKESEVEK